ncbi:MAG: RNB domain-containing ribonuclease [Oligoflexia bacterium]|nr:RNB domain-containing ribonuclease [Oligoflexia bacterium]
MPDFTPPNSSPAPLREGGPSPRAGREEVPGMAIDAADAREEDDAIWLRREGKDRILTISIADVAAHVSKDSLADLRARELGATRYLRTRDIFMLPELQATGAASLIAGESRMTFSCEVPFSSSGAVGSARFFPSILNVKSLTYEQASQALENPDAPEHHTLTELHQLARILSLQRAARGALSIYNPQRSLLTNEEGRLVRIEAPQFAAHFVVAECMIFANELAANFFKQRGVAAFFRCQWAAGGAERARMIEGLSRMVNSENSDPANLEPLMLRRRLGYGFYDAEPLEHFSLATDAYCHVTSPHRRFADLANNRILSALLRGEPSPYSRAEIDSICEELWNQSHEHRVSRRAARQLVRHKAAGTQLKEVLSSAAARILIGGGLSGQTARACAAATFPAEELARIDAVLESELASQATIMALIFMNAESTSEAQRHKQRALSLVVERPGLAVEVLHSLKSLVPQIAIKFAVQREAATEEAPPIQSARVHWSIGRVRWESKIWISTDRKMALGLAAAEFIFTAAQRLDFLPELIERERRESQFILAERIEARKKRATLTPPGYSLRKLELLCERLGWGRPYWEIVALPTAEGRPQRFRVSMEVALRRKLVRHELQLEGADKQVLTEQACVTFQLLLRHELKPRTAAGIHVLGRARELTNFCRERYLPAPKSKFIAAAEGMLCRLEVFVPGYGSLSARGKGATRAISLGRSSAQLLSALKELLGAGSDPAWMALLAKKTEQR